MENVLETAQTVLRATPVYWTTLAGSAPADLLKRAPAEGEWSALECLLHMIDFEGQGVPERIQAFLEGQNFPVYPPGRLSAAGESQSPQAAAEEFARLRKANLERLAQVTPADMARKSIHARLGEVSFDEMMHQWAAHDLNHTIQAQRAIIQPFIAGCGPWQGFFASQVINA